MSVSLGENMLEFMKKIIYFVKYLLYDYFKWKAFNMIHLADIFRCILLRKEYHTWTFLLI